MIKESPGFITSRINAMIGNEAFYMLQEGIASAQDIDKALKLGLNHPMGPFELVDLVGLDTRLHILEYMQKSLGEKYRPAPLLVQYVKAGRLGRKAGRGVYEYPEQKQRRKKLRLPRPGIERQTSPPALCHSERQDPAVIPRSEATGIWVSAGTQKPGSLAPLGMTTMFSNGHLSCAVAHARAHIIP